MPVCVRATTFQKLPTRLTTSFSVHAWRALVSGEVRQHVTGNNSISGRNLVGNHSISGEIRQNVGGNNSEFQRKQANSLAEYGKKKSIHGQNCHIPETTHPGAH
jgi:hypothetical protein